MSLVQRPMPQVGSANLQNGPYSRSSSERYRDVGRANNSGQRTQTSRSPSVPRSGPIASLPPRPRALSNASASSRPRNAPPPMPSRYPEASSRSRGTPPDNTRYDDRSESMGNLQSTAGTPNRITSATEPGSQSRRRRNDDQNTETPVAEPYSAPLGADQDLSSRQVEDYLGQYYPPHVFPQLSVAETGGMYFWLTPSLSLFRLIRGYTCASNGFRIIGGTFNLATSCNRCRVANSQCGHPTRYRYGNRRWRT